MSERCRNSYYPWTSCRTDGGEKKPWENVASWPWSLEAYISKHIASQLASQLAKWEKGESRGPLIYIRYR